MRLRLLAAMGATALAASFLGAAPAQADPPDAPLITAVNPGPVVGSVEVTWTPPNSPGITNYRIRYHAINPVGSWSNPVETEGADPTAVVGGLTSGQQYVFQVAAENQDGWGAWSADSQPVAPTGLNPPTNLRATPADASVILTWTAPNPAPLGYQVEYQLNAPGSPWTDAGSTASTSFRVLGLDPAQQYFFRVSSTNGGGQTSTPVTTTTPVGPISTPGSPTNVLAVAGDGLINVSWGAPFPAPEGYQLQYSVAGTEVWQPVPPSPVSGTSTTVSGLTNGTTYVIQVRSVRGSAVSAYATSNPATPGSTWPVPAAPTSVTAVPGNGLAVMYWTVPAGNPATNYEVAFSTNNTNWSDPIRTNSTALNYTLTGLSNGVGYYLRVRTINGPQNSAWTQLPGFITPLGVPGPPTSVSGVAGNNQVTVSWVPPVNTGVVVTGYRVQYSVNGGASWVPAADLSVPSTSVVVGGLTNGVGYVFRVQAKSQSGDSAWSATSAVVVPPGGPAAPINLAAAAGNASATVSWTPSAGTQTFPILGYRITATPGGQICTTSATPPALPATTCIVTGLTNGQPYTFTAVAISGAGTSPSSAASNVVVPVGGPNPPTGVVATPGDRQATVTWIPPASSTGGPITGYRVTSSPEGRTCATNATPPATPATSCTVTGLTNGQSYTFTVVAISASGTSAPSAPSAAVVPVGGPNPPTGVSANAGDRQATVTWNPPSSTSGGPITSYRVVSSPEGRSCTTNATPPATPATSCTVTGLTNGQAYTFTVVAISASGTSAPSAASDPVTPFTTEVTIRITDSSRDGRKVIIKGTTQGLDPGDTLDVLIRNSGKGKFTPAGEVTVKSNGTFRWTTTNAKKTWVRVTDGDVVSNTVIVPAR